MSDLKERLMTRRPKTIHDHPQSEPLRNPDGPAAFARIAALEEKLRAAREGLMRIAEGYDSGRHDGLPEDYPAHDADTMFALARTTLQSIGDENE